MIEIPFENRELVYDLYEEVKRIVLSKKDNSYNHHQHHLYEESEHPGISKNYYNEDGEVTYKNINNQVVTIKFNRWHPHKHNGYSGLNGNPCRNVQIYINDELVWQLEVKSGTLYYKALITSEELPRDLLKEKEKKEEKVEKKVIEESPVNNVTTNKPTIDITSIRESYTSTLTSKEELLKKMKEEIDRVTEEIIKKYTLEIEQNENNINSAKKELQDFDALVTKYSTFDIDLIGLVIQKLMSFMENENFVFSEVTHEYSKRVHGPIDSWDETVRDKVFLVVQSDYLKHTYIEDELDKLISLGLGVILTRQPLHSKNKNITFYSSVDGNISLNIDFNNFTYIKDFINILIKYRYDNDIELTGDDLTKLLRDYLMNNKDTIMANLNTKIENKVLQLSIDLNNK